jgi:copper resistance protein D
MLYYLNVTIHVLAAVLWLGGMFFLAIVGAPVLRTVQPAELRARLFSELGRRYRVVGWIAIVVLVLTGLANLHFRGVLSAPTLTSGEFWRSRYGTALGWKLASVAAMLLFQALHDFVLGPAASRLPSGSPDLVQARRRAALLARGSALLGIVVVIAAVRLARGG